MDIRPLEESDFPACVEIFNEAFNDVHRAYGFDEDLVDDDDTWLLKPLQHFLRTDPNGGLIAADDRGTVAFASTVRREQWWFLSFLFVRPRVQQQGIGRELIRRLLPSQESGPTIATMVESFNRAATGLYASEGMIPLTPKYWVTASTDAVQLPGASGLRRSEMTRDDSGSVASLDRDLLGFTRGEDHRWWMESMRGFTYRLDDRLVGYAYVDDGWIAPALAVDEPTLISLFMDLAKLVDKDEVETAVLSTSRQLLRALLRSGFRIGPSTYSSVYASSGGTLPASYILHADWLP
jgi:GNAT superfamily N-acetyltransferase